ncbi:MAG: PQQ-binding-like beta-propeller repeat protein [Marinilabiliaceae bacterium]|jgi:outer membrane protein assembly factor BamB|nr:PQQ-binding-like beta-propeller repeat protein [Marinilabiliaceae bacterium]
MKKAILGLSLISIVALFSASAQDPVPEKQWSSYRGHKSQGYLDNVNLPLNWDIDSGHNLLWEKEIPGLALSSPVIWGDRLFITTAISEKDTSGLRTNLSGSVEPVEDSSEHTWKVYCINKHSGDIIWEDSPVEGVPKIKRHPMSTHANTSMASDGRYAVAFFGSEGLYCYDIDGNLLWDKNFGVLKSVFFNTESAEWEFASSPILHKGVVLVQVDVLGDSFVAAFMAETGEEIWKVSRDEYPGWSTPNVYSYKGRDIVVVNGYKYRAAYDFLTGREIWRMSGGGDIPIPTPVIGDELVYFNSAHGRFAPVLAVKKDATGDITLKEDETSNSGVAWSYPRGGSYMQTMLLYRGYLYNLRYNGQLNCFDAVTGEEKFREKIGKADFFLASPVAADGKIYIASVAGEVYTIPAGPEFKIESMSELGDVFMTTPAITDGVIFFRTENKLIAIGNQQSNK